MTNQHIPNRRIVLLREQHLLGESLENLLTGLDDVSLVGIYSLDTDPVPEMMADDPDLVVIADEIPFEEQVIEWLSYLGTHFPFLPVIRVNFERSTLQLFTTQKLPARIADLADIIRNIPLSDSAGSNEPELTQ